MGTPVDRDRVVPEGTVKEERVKFISALLIGFNLIGIMYLGTAVGETWGSFAEGVINVLVLLGLLLVYPLSRGKRARSVDAAIASGDSVGRS